MGVTLFMLRDRHVAIDETIEVHFDKIEKLGIMRKTAANYYLFD